MRGFVPPGDVSGSPCGLVDHGGILESPGANACTATLPEGDGTLLFWTADAAVRGTVVGVGKATEDEYPADGGHPLVTLRVDEALRRESRDPMFPDPDLADNKQITVIVRSPADAIGDLKTDAAYVLFLPPGGYFDDDDGNIVVPDYWSLRLATSPTVCRYPVSIARVVTQSLTVARLLGVPACGADLVERSLDITHTDNEGGFGRSSTIGGFVMRRGVLSDGLVPGSGDRRGRRWRVPECSIAGVTMLVAFPIVSAAVNTG